MDIISRTQWEARYPDGFQDAPIPADEVWAHHSVTIAPDLVWLDADRDGVDDDEEKAMRHLESIGQDRFGGGISYTWLIPPSGRIYQGHSPGRQGAHTGGRNDRARAICFIGNYEENDLTPAQIRAAAWLLQHAKAEGWIKHARLNGGHRDLKQTACPGKHAYARIAEINRLAAGPPIEEDDMPDRQEFEFWVKNGVLKALMDDQVRAWVERAVWIDRKVYRDGKHIPAIQELADAKTEALATRGMVAGLEEAHRQDEAGEARDLDAVAAAAERGTRKALTEGTVTVDIDITGPEGQTA